MFPQSPLVKSQNSTPVDDEKKSNVITTHADDKPKFGDLITASTGAIVDLTSPVKRTSLLSTYGGTAEVKKENASDFLSRLHNSSQSINFNSTSSVKFPSMSSLSTTNSSVADSSQARKRKYRLIDSEPTPIVKEEKSNVDEQLPQDRTELVKLLKDRLKKENYKRLLTALKSYQSSFCVSLFYKEMSAVFEQPEHHYMLRGMSLFLKGSHREEFETLLALNKN